MFKQRICAGAILASAIAGCGPKAGADHGKKEVVGQWVFDIDATVNQYPENPLAGPYRAATPEQQAQMRGLSAAKPFMEFFDDGRTVLAIGQGARGGMKGTWSWNGSAYVVKLEEKGEDPSFTFRDGKLTGGGNPETLAVFVKLGTPLPAAIP